MYTFVDREIVDGTNINVGSLKIKYIFLKKNLLFSSEYNVKGFPEDPYPASMKTLKFFKKDIFSLGLIIMTAFI